VPPPRIRVRSRLLAALLPLSALAAPAAAQAVLPFGLGEALRYEVRIAPFGTVGTARMWIEGPVEEQGIPTWRLRSEIEAGVGPVRGLDRTSSWLDPVTGGILRFEKTEAHPLSRGEERVRVDRTAQRWHDAAAGREGPLGAAVPLDELSFLYFLRTLPLEHDTVLVVARHYDADRNPTRVTIRGHEVVSTPAGIFRTRVIEMEVRDPRRYHGVGRIRINLDDDVCRFPVRIESRMPRLGVTTLVLAGWAHPPRYPGAVTC
jgi:Protein of unknown function (DUF3108)